MKYKQTKKTNHTENPASKKHLGLRAFSLGFLAVFVLTIVFGLLISGSSVALFSTSSNTITMQFEAAAGHSPSLQELLDILIDEVRTQGVLANANSNYFASGGNKNSWSVILENHLVYRSPSDPAYEFRNPLSNSTQIYNQPSLPTGDDINPAVFITEYGNHINFDNGADSSLWGTMIVYSSGQGNNTIINYVIVDTHGNVGPVTFVNFNLYK